MEGYSYAHSAPEPVRIGVLDASSEDRAGPGVAGTDYPGLRGRQTEQGSRAARGWTGCLTAPSGNAPQGQRCRCGKGAYDDLGIAGARCHPNWSARSMAGQCGNWLLKRPRFQKQICRGAHRSVCELETDIKNYPAVSNQSPKLFVWTKTAGDILASLARFCKRTSETGHQRRKHAPRRGLVYRIP